MRYRRNKFTFAISSSDEFLYSMKLWLGFKIVHNFYDPCCGTVADPGFANGPGGARSSAAGASIEAPGVGLGEGYPPPQ